MPLLVTRCGGDLTTVTRIPGFYADTYALLVTVSAPLATYTTRVDTLQEALTWALTDSLPHELDPDEVVSLDPRLVGLHP